MREIKFRLRLDNEIVGYEKWYSGELAEVTPDEPGDLYWRAHPCWLYSPDETTWRPAPIFHNRKDAFINLPDKNGVGIYEGDVVTHPAFPDRPIQVVHLDGKNVSEFVVIDELGFPMQTMALTVCKVIGNIYENPELVE